MRTTLSLLSFCLIANCFAAPPPGLTPDPALHAWFEALRQPGQKLPCCSISDCRVTASHLRNQHYEVEIDGYRYVVPDKTIIRDIPNPVGSAVVCYTYSGFGPPAPPGKILTEPQDTVEILCFVPPRPLS